MHPYDTGVWERLGRQSTVKVKMVSSASHPAEAVTLKNKGTMELALESWNSSMQQTWETGTGIARLQILVQYKKLQQKNGWSPSPPNKAYKNLFYKKKKKKRTPPLKWVFMHKKTLSAPAWFLFHPSLFKFLRQMNHQKHFQPRFDCKTIAFLEEITHCVGLDGFL